MNVSYAAATQWLFNFVVARSVPVMLVTLGGETGYGYGNTATSYHTLLTFLGHTFSLAVSVSQCSFSFGSSFQKPRVSDSTTRVACR